MSQETCDICPEDVEEAIKVLKGLPNIATNSADVLRNVTDKLLNGDLEMLKGLSFLNLKNLCMLNYISNLSYIILRKLNGKKIENNPSVNHLVELRVTMEKMKPIEEKLKYHTNKLLATVASQNVDTKDPLQFRANPDSLDVQEEIEDDSEEPKESKVYVPPKIAATYYEEDNVMDHKKKALEKAQKRALSSSMLYELRKEYDTGPEEIKAAFLCKSETIFAKLFPEAFLCPKSGHSRDNEMHDPHKLKLSEELKRREMYEEEYMLRLPMTKKQRHDMRQLTTVTNFNTKFEDISALEMRPDNMQMKKKSRGKRDKFKGKGKKKGFKKKY